MAISLEELTKQHQMTSIKEMAELIADRLGVEGYIRAFPDDPYDTSGPTRVNYTNGDWWIEIITPESMFGGVISSSSKMEIRYRNDTVFQSRGGNIGTTVLANSFNCYKPGQWEDELEQLYQKALKSEKNPNFYASCNL
jgi:hypothetical protein